MKSAKLVRILGPLGLNKLTANEANAFRTRLQAATGVPFARLAEGKPALDLGESSLIAFIGAGVVAAIFGFIRWRHGPRMDDVGRHMLEASIVAPVLVALVWLVVRRRIRLTATTLSWGNALAPWSEVTVPSVREARFHIRRDKTNGGLDIAVLSVRLEASGGPVELTDIDQETCVAISRAIPAAAPRGVFSEF